MSYQSPISPGISWYEATAGERPEYAPLDGSRKADVVVVGGGFTGLQAACRLAEGGSDVVLIDAARFGDGASGRNGGQLGTGHRTWPEEQAEAYGYAAARALFRLAEDAKAHLLDFAGRHGIEIDYRPGQMSVVHKSRYIDDYRRHADVMAEKYDYPHIRFMEGEETARRLGSKRYLAGIRDTGTGHIHPLKLLVGTAKAAARAGAELHEHTPATRIRSEGGRVSVDTPRGTITAERALIACNGYIGGLEPTTAAHVMPIRSFIGATVPLDEAFGVLPGGESVDDSRFVVRYFRKSADGRLLFGGREAYTSDNPRDISHHIRRQISELYPALGNIEITHAWGGSVGITMPREPFVREVLPGVTSIGGFSGHGVMLSNYTGKLYAETVLGNRDLLEPLEALEVPSFPGGPRLRKPLLFLAMSWFALRDRL